MIEEDDVNKITSNFSFKGTNIYAFKDSLPQLSKNKALNQPLKELITVYHNVYNKKSWDVSPEILSISLQSTLSNLSTGIFWSSSFGR